MALDAGKMIGPLPLGAWAAVIAGGLGIALYTRQQNNAALPDDTIVEDTGGVPGVGEGGSGMGWVDVSPPTTGSVQQAPTTNEEWGRLAVNYLIATGYDPATADSAIRKYLAAEKLSMQEFAMIGIALAKLGSPAVPLPPSTYGNPTIPKPPSPHTPTKPPTKPPPPKPKPPAPKPKVRYYFVRPGDNLSRIAQRYYGRQDWQRIYNANKSRIRNPNKIYPGQRLIIP